MWRALLAGVAAIAVLVAASLAVIVMVTRDEPATAGRRRDAAAAPEPAEDLPPPAKPLPPGTPLTFGSPSPAPVERPPVPAPQGPPPKDSWEAVPVTGRARSLGRMGGAIAARLTDLRDDLSRCFTYEAQAQLGSGQVTEVRDAAPLDDHGGIVLMLQLEGQAGGLRVVDAPVETRGPAGDELLACAQRTLRGRVLAVPGAVPGQRIRLLHPLIP